MSTYIAIAYNSFEPEIEKQTLRKLVRASSVKAVVEQLRQTFLQWYATDCEYAEELMMFYNSDDGALTISSGEDGYDFSIVAQDGNAIGLLKVVK